MFHDVHRAFGLWLWVLLLALAVSGVAMNLRDEVFRPVVGWVSELAPTPAEHAARLGLGSGEPRIGFGAALAAAQRMAAERGWPQQPVYAFHAAELGGYGVGLTLADRDPWAGLGPSWVYLSDRDGSMIAAELKGEGSAGDVFSQLQFPVHSGHVAGLPGRILVAVAGLATAVLSATGVYVWAVKRAGRRRSAYRAGGHIPKTEIHVASGNTDAALRRTGVAGKAPPVVGSVPVPRTSREAFALPFAALAPAELAAWRALRLADARYDSAFYAPELVAALAAVRGGIEVAVALEAGAPVAFLPFRRAALGTALPVAGPFSDVDGPIIAPGARVDWRALLRACGLSSWVFQHVPAEHEQLLPFHVTTMGAPFLDLSGGFDAYVRRRNELGGRELKGALRKARRAGSEVAPLRFTPNLDGDGAVDTLLAWKREQIRARGLPDPIASSWVSAFLRRVASLREPGCTGMLSALHFGDRLAALGLGVRSHHVYHGWITVYDPSLARHSPGALFLLELARSAERLGLSRIDMGPGREAWKWRFHTGARNLAGGAVHARAFLEPALHAALHLQEWARRARLAASGRGGLRRQPARGVPSDPGA